jgi:hypothetical protein
MTQEKESYYQRNKEKVTEYLRKYYRENKAKLVQKQKEMRSAMTEEERAQENAFRRLYYAANAERLREQNRNARRKRKLFKKSITNKGVSP